MVQNLNLERRHYVTQLLDNHAIYREQSYHTIIIKLVLGLDLGL